jgi:calcineurin-like phosphoesterase family protein
MKLCDRPFANVKEMDEYIVDKWNKKVSDNDMVWILGDIVSPEHFDKDLLNRLNGKIYLLLGNHDYPVRELIASETKIELCAENALYSDDNIVMFHYPIMDWNGRDNGTIHLYGHVHSNKDNHHPLLVHLENAYNVGCDVHNFEPVSLGEIL